MGSGMVEEREDGGGGRLVGEEMCIGERWGCTGVLFWERKTACGVRSGMVGEEMCVRGRCCCGGWCSD